MVVSVLVVRFVRLSAVYHYFKDMTLECMCACCPSPIRMTCPARKDEADWLVELTGESGRAYRANPAEIVDLGLGKVPETAEDFHAKWRESDIAKAIDQARLPQI